MTEEKRREIQIVGNCAINSKIDTKERASEIAEISEAQIKRNRTLKSYKKAEEKLKIAKLQHYIKNCGRMRALAFDQVGIPLRERMPCNGEEDDESSDEESAWHDTLETIKYNEKTWKKQLRKLINKH